MFQTLNDLLTNILKCPMAFTDTFTEMCCGSKGGNLLWVAVCIQTGPYRTNKMNRATVRIRLSNSSTSSGCLPRAQLTFISPFSSPEASTPSETVCIEYNGTLCAFLLWWSSFPVSTSVAYKSPRLLEPENRPVIQGFQIEIRFIENIIRVTLTISTFRKLQSSAWISLVVVICPHSIAVLSRTVGVPKVMNIT